MYKAIGFLLFNIDNSVSCIYFMCTYVFLNYTPNGVNVYALNWNIEAQTIIHIISAFKIFRMVSNTILRCVFRFMHVYEFRSLKFEIVKANWKILWLRYPLLVVVLIFHFFLLWKRFSNPTKIINTCVLVKYITCLVFFGSTHHEIFQHEK